jgi:GT2 family glycosyltransferase
MRTLQKAEPPKVAILILNYNGRKYLKECIDSVLATTYPSFDVIIIDNASKDDSLEFVKKNYPKIKLIEYEENYGFALAYNKAINLADAPYLAILNNDTVVEPDWLNNLIPHMDNEKVAALNPKILFLHDRNRINAAGGSCDIFGFGMNRGNGDPDCGQYDKSEEVFYVNGAALISKKAVWQDVGAFDERYFLYGEDLDWCWRARLRGYEVLYVPTAKVYHHWQGAGGQMTLFLERHWLATILKNYSPKTLFSIFARYLGLKVLEHFWLLKNGRDLSEKAAVIEGLLWNLKNLKTTWEKHLQVQASRKISDREIQMHMYGGSFEVLLWLRKIKHPLASKYRKQT